MFEITLLNPARTVTTVDSKNVTESIVKYDNYEPYLVPHKLSYLLKSIKFDICVFLRGRKG